MTARLPRSTTPSRVLLATLLGLGLAACGSTRLASELKPYVGRDMHDLVAHLGKPTGQREDPGERVYVWATDYDGTLATQPFTESPGGGGGVSYAGSATRAGLIPVQFQCTIEVTVDAHNIVQRYDIEGSTAGCARYRQALSH